MKKTTVRNILRRYSFVVFACLFVTINIVACSDDEKTSAKHETPVADEVFSVGGVEFKMVYVEGGSFTMGATQEQGSDVQNDEKPAHSVTLSSYYIGEAEVTQGLWKAVMGTNPSGNKIGDSFPVEKVSYADVLDFIAKLNTMTKRNFRLPTEAEWEFAARGGNKTMGFKYSGSNNIDAVAWYDDGNPDMHTHEVKTKIPNELGVYDMSGNVYEWCSDWKEAYTSDAQTNPQGASSGSSRVIRGGCFLTDSGPCRVSKREESMPGFRNYYIGFRLSLSR